MANYLCPNCGESTESFPDTGAGSRQQYIEDCTVCCRPNRLSAVYLPEHDEFELTAESEA
jgi:hypothetical protein